MKTKAPCYARPSRLLRAVLRHASPVSKVCISSVSRNRKRFLLSALCMTLSMFMIILSFTCSTSLSTLLRRTYEERYQYHCQMFLDYERPAEELWEAVVQIEGVTEGECVSLAVLPLSVRGEERDVLLCGLSSNADLLQLENGAGERIPIPHSGVILSEKTAAELNVAVGDSLTVNGHSVPVTHLAHLNLDFTQYCSLPQMNTLTGEEGGANSVLIRYTGMTEEELYDRLSEIDGFSYCTYMRVQQADTRRQVDMIYTGAAFAVMFAGCIGFFIIYTMSVIHLEERSKEFAILKTLGYQNSSIVLHTFWELLAQWGIACVIALSTGALCGDWLLSSIESSVISFSNENTPLTYISAAFTVFAFMSFGHIAAARQIHRFNLPYILKEKE